jgi:group I intron endonuclease
MHIRKDSNQPFYIGKGSGNRAYWAHGRNKHWSHIAKKHGFDVAILANWASEKDAFEHEKFLIWCFKDMGASLVNLTDGGDGPAGQKFTAEQKEKMSVVHKELYANGYQSPKGMLGKKHSEETKQKMKETHANRDCSMSDEAKKKISESSKGKAGTFGHKGKKHTEAAKLKSSMARKGVPWTEARRAAQRSKQS